MKEEKINQIKKKKISKEQEKQSEKMSGLLSEIGKLNIRIQLLERELIYKNNLLKRKTTELISKSK